MLRKKYVLGVGITDATKEDILKYILQGLKKPGEKYYIVTPNPEILVYAKKDDSYKNILNNARLALPDGIGVIWAGKILGKKIREKISGTDFLEKLCFMLSKQPITVGFLGGRGKIAEMTAECLVNKYPGLRVAFVGSEWSVDKQTDYRLQTTAVDGRPKTVDLLFVAFGSPKQEQWIVKDLNRLPVKVAMGVGGAFDYISGQVPRAPLFIRTMGFEWLFRLIVQPWRIKRQLALLEFVWMVFKEKFALRSE